MSKITHLIFFIWLTQISIAQKIEDNFFISGSDGNGGTSSVVQFPAIAYNSLEEEYLVVWAGKYDNANDLDADESEIWGQRIDAATGNPIDSNFRISDLGPNQNNTYGANAPKVAYNPKYNEYLVVFYGDNNEPPIVNGESEIYGQRLDADGNEIGENDFRISTMGDELETDRTVRKKFDGYFPDVVYNETNDEYMVVWYGDNIENDLEVWAQRLKGVNGNEIGTDFRVSFVNTNDSAYINDDPVISWNSVENQYLVSWHGGNFNNKTYQIHGQLLDSTGFLLDTTFQISNSPMEEAKEAFSTYNKDRNEYLVIWGDESGSDQFLIKGQLLDATGAKIDATIDVSNNGENEIRYLDSQVAEAHYDPLGKEYVVVWSGNIAMDTMEANYKVHYIPLNDSTGQAVDTAFILSNSSGNMENNPSPALGFRSSTREFLVVWTANNPLEVSGQRFETQNYTCSDGIQNGDETSIDCGGACPDICCIIGDLCDDGNSNTINDSLTIDCICIGTSIALLNTKVFLQGVFKDSLMLDSLRAKDILPIQSPYSDNLIVGDAMLTFAMNGDTSIVDWVEIELRKTAGGTSVAKRSALLRRDGQVVDENGDFPLRFPDLVVGEYYVIIRHNNHLSLMTAEKIRLE